MKKATVIIPAYNKAELTSRAIKSVLRQTYKNVEIIVVDDGSTDDTLQTVSGFKDQVKYVHKLNGGACSARNLGIKLATGDYIGFLDCDDMYLPEKVQLSVEYLEANPEAGFLHTGAYFIDDKDYIVGKYSHRKSLQTGWISKQLILGNYICNPTVFVRRETLKAAGFFDESIFMPADWDLWIRLSEVAKAGYINMPHSMYRVTDNYTFDRLELAEKEEAVVVENYFKRNPNSKGLKNRALSNLYLRFAQCHFLKEDYPRLKQQFLQTLRSDPANFKAIGLFFYYMFFRKNLKTKLTEKILRYNA